MMMMIWGTFNSFGVFFESFIREFGWTRAIISGGSALNTMIFGILCVFSAGLSERLGPRWVMTICGIILGLGYFLMAQMTSIWELYLYFGVFVAIGMSAYIPLLSLVPKWFTTRRGRMNAIVLSGMGLGIMIVPPVASTLISLWQWRNSYRVMAIVTLIVMVAASQFLRSLPNPKDNGQNTRTAIRSVDHKAEGLTLRQAVRTKQFALVCLLYFSFLFCLVAITVHMVVHAIGLNIPATRASLTLSLIGGACVVGMNVMGNLADRFSNRIALGISYSLMGLSLLWLIPSQSEWSFYLFSILFGFAYGGMQVLFSPPSQSSLAPGPTESSSRQQPWSVQSEPRLARSSPAIYLMRSVLIPSRLSSVPSWHLQASFQLCFSRSKRDLKARGFNGRSPLAGRKGTIRTISPFRRALACGQDGSHHTLISIPSDHPR